MRAGQDLAVALLKACGVPSDDVTDVVFRVGVNDVARLDVTYRIIKTDPQPVVFKHTVRFVQAVDE